MSETAARLRESADGSELLREEERLGLSARFAEIDAILGGAIAAAFSGEKILEISVRKQGPSLLKLTTLSREERTWLNEHFSRGAHEVRGAWYLADLVKVNASAFTLVEALLSQPRYAATLVGGLAATASSTSGEAVFVWAALNPLFETLVLPLNLRSRQAGTKSREEMERAWAAFDPVARALGLGEEEAVRAFRADAGWAAASPAEHSERRRQLGELLRRQASADLGRRYRAYRLQMLIERYNAKAKKKRPTSSQVVRRADEPNLTAVFAGDWLAFLEYLGEQPAEDEEVITALPKAKLFVSGNEQELDAEVPGALNHEVERTLVGSGEAISPIRQREHALRQLWQALDELNAHQEPEKLPPNCYPLAEDWGDESELDGDSDLVFSWETRSFLDDLREVTLASEQLETEPKTVRLPADLVRAVETLWATMTIERYPQAIVTNLAPWGEAQRALGPAFAFWQGIFLALWNNFEESYDERTVRALRSHFRDERRQLEALGCPIDDSLFEQLIEAEATLPPPQEVVLSEGPGHEVMGVELRVVMTSGLRRQGFAKMRDIVTAQRRFWAAAHLDGYLARLWQDELRTLAEALARHIAHKHKAPTARQLARLAAAVANRWCGGRIDLVCAAIGAEETLEQHFDPKVPAARRIFLRRLFTALGGELTTKIDYAHDDARTQKTKEQIAHHQRGIGELTIGALRLLQLEEALGTTPTLKQYGTANFQRHADQVWETGVPDEQWERYLAAVDEALTGEPVPADLPSSRGSRPPVRLRDSEPERAAPRGHGVGISFAAAASIGEVESPGLIGRLFSRHKKTETETPPARVAGSAAADGPEPYVLESEGRFDVVGESYYQEALEATRALLRYDRQLGREVFDARLIPEPKNKYDPKAIAVYSLVGKIGHTPRGSLWIDVLNLLAESGHASATCRAWLIGGGEGEYIGAVLCADPDEELNFLTH